MTQHYYDRYYEARFGRRMPSLSNNIPELVGIVEATRLISVEAKKRQALFIGIVLIFITAIAL